MLLGIFTANCQSISVKSFHRLESDQEARISSPKTDQNGKKCAIIKVVTSQSGFVFDFGLIGNAIATEQKTGEIWVWVPAGARKVTISHQLLGVLRNYPFDIDIEEATVYEMVLTTGKVVTTVEEQIESQWLVINTEPDDAMVYIDNAFIKKGVYQSKLKPGKYSYRVESLLYHSEAGEVEISNDKKVLNIKLKPAFGFLMVSSEPEHGAQVIIDGKVQTGVTPFKSERLASGEHTLQIVKEMYQPTFQKITVTDEQTAEVNVTLRPNFAEVNITALSDAIIYINNQQKGKGTWQGRLSEGVYSLEAKLDRHQTAKKDIDLKTGDKRSVDLQPVPICGSLDVISTPVDAKIIINGKQYGTTPNTIPGLLIGYYNVIIQKEGYATVNKPVVIEQDKNTEVNETLTPGILVTIKGDPSDAQLYIDNSLTGSTPYIGMLAFGSHKLSLQKGNEKIEKNIEIKQDGETTFVLSLKPQLVTDADGNIYHIVTIGTQTWMVENLRTTKFNDGTAIPNITDNKTWQGLNSPGVCSYDNTSNYNMINTYGLLYNWYSVNTAKLAPKGWHVPTDAEWKTLTEYLGGNSVAGGKLKEVGTTHWYSPNTGADNSSGFTALPGGYRDYDGTFSRVGYTATGGVLLRAVPITPGTGT